MLYISFNATKVSVIEGRKYNPCVILCKMSNHMLKSMLKGYSLVSISLKQMEGFKQLILDGSCQTPPNTTSIRIMDYIF